MPSSVPLSISVSCLTIGQLLFQLLSVASYRYVVALGSKSASVMRWSPLAR